MFMVVSGCAGTKVLDEPVALETTQSIGVVEDGRVRMTLDWIIVRHGPGTWARRASWDEYLVRFENLSQSPVNLQNAKLIDSLGETMGPGLSRKTLVEASRSNLRRYEGLDIPVKPGEGSTTMLVAGGGRGAGWRGYRAGRGKVSCGAISTDARKLI